MIVGDALRRVVAHLDASGIPHMIAGSCASMFHGHARTTHDIHMVIDADAATHNAFIASLPDADYYVDHDTARDALRRRSQFNIIELATGWKLDLIIRKARAFSIEEFGRRQPAVIAGVKVFVATAEARVVQARVLERQLQDVAGIVAVRGDTLDIADIHRWVDELGLRDWWRLASTPTPSPSLRG